MRGPFVFRSRVDGPTLADMAYRFTPADRGAFKRCRRQRDFGARERRRYEPAEPAGAADLDGAVLCVAHAAEPGVRAAIAADARAAGVLVNVMDDVPNCDFAAPAIVRRGDLIVAIGTGGRAPALAGRLRAELGRRFGPDWAELVELVGQVRTATLAHLPDFEDRSRRWKAALDLDELEQLIAAGQADEAATRLRDRLLEGVSS